jgi:iron complex outermembrane receptor protein
MALSINVPAARLLLIAGPVLALAEPAFGQLDEIIVTARRVEERLQNAPVSVSAFSEATLVNADIRDVSDLAKFTPNLTFTGGYDGRLALPVIRGLGVIDTRGFDNSVGIFVDGVFISGRAAQNVGILDLERVEVVRGPQSALYGRNTFAGAINYVTKKPTEEFEGSVEATAATDELYRVKGTLSGPIISDKLLGRAAFLYDDDEGTWSNAGPAARGDGIGGHEYKVAMASLRWLPSQSAEVTLSAYYADEFVDNVPLSRVENNCGELDPAKSPTTLGSYDRGVPAYFCGEVLEAPGSSLSMSPEAFSADGETWRVSLDLDFDLGAFNLRSITSYTNNENVSAADLDRTQAGDSHYGYLPLSVYEAADSPIPLFAPVLPITPANFNTFLGSQELDQEYWSQEIRLQSKLTQRLRWLAGAYYFFNENFDTTSFGADASAAVADLGIPTEEIQFLLVDTAASGLLFAIPSPLLQNLAYRNGPETVVLTLGKTEATQLAGFGALEFDLSEKLTGTAELRYTYEERELDNIRDDFFGTDSGSFDEDYDFWDPRFILRYRPNDDLMAYGSIAKGSRSGGLNPLVSDPAFVSYEPEENWTYELGFKSVWADGLLQLNASAYYIDWEDAQFRQRVISPTGATLTLTTNATGITSYGAEFELVAAPSDGVTLSLGYGYADPEFDNGTLSTGEVALCRTMSASESEFPVIPVDCVPIDVDGDGVFEDAAPDLSGKQLVRTSKHTLTASAEVVKPLVGETDFLLRLDTSYRSKQYTDLANIQSSPSRTLVNLKLGIQHQRYDLIFFVENLLEEDAIESTQVFNSDLNSRRFVTTAVNIPGRRFGVTGRFRF